MPQKLCELAECIFTGNLQAAMFLKLLSSIWSDLLNVDVFALVQRTTSLLFTNVQNGIKLYLEHSPALLATRIAFILNFHHLTIIIELSA